MTSITGSRAGRSTRRRELMHELMLSQGSLRELAEQTGGIASVNTNSLTTAFDRIVRGQQPLLRARLLPADARARRPLPQDRSQDEAPGAARRGAQGIRVAARPDGRRAEARRSGQARARSETPQRRQDVHGAARDAHQPADAERPQLHRARRAVQEHAEGSVGRARHRDRRRSPAVFAPDAKGMAANKIELSFYGISDHGKALAGTRSVLDLTLRPETRERVKAYGVRVNPRISLPPGRYHLRIGARDAVGRHDRHGVLRSRGPRFPQREADDGRAAAHVEPRASRRRASSPIRSSRKLLPAPPRAGASSRSAISSRSTRRFTTTSNRSRLAASTSPCGCVSESGTEVFAVRDELENGGVAPKKAVGHLRLLERDCAEERRAGPLRAARRSAGAWKRRRRKAGRPGNADHRRPVDAGDSAGRVSLRWRIDAKLDRPPRHTLARPGVRPDAGKRWRRRIRAVRSR